MSLPPAEASSLSFQIPTLKELHPAENAVAHLNILRAQIRDRLEFLQQHRRGFLRWRRFRIVDFLSAQPSPKPVPLQGIHVGLGPKKRVLPSPQSAIAIFRPEKELIFRLGGRQAIHQWLRPHGSLRLGHVKRKLPREPVMVRNYESGFVLLEQLLARLLDGRSGFLPRPD